VYEEDGCTTSHPNYVIYKGFKMKNKIGIIVLCSALFGLGSAEAAYVSVNNATGNSTRARALNLDSNFDRVFDADIGNPFTNISTTYLHASVNATTSSNNNGLDWYSFTTTRVNVQAFFDIDKGMPDLDSWIKLYDSNGIELVSNDDGRVLDPGSTNGWDSFISSVLVNPGLYYLSVGQYNNNRQVGLSRNDDYTLHVSLAPAIPAAVPVPAAVWLFASGFAGLMGYRRKQTKVG
jgi:hypothetical protein